ncbi:flagellar motor switch phosphatase FliY [Niallia sp. NCCP-28]|uniref:flagellar motor switch phosphatase FliY n=1 Tax=Niallia sp. NCCP-28 TaxID=2934712 RepID=UPI0020882535|nr:flagellar motor switch phosphatase FliY [Niallia sp. NCCP-28]GKU82481.1 flagellar motor switch phosphatase FliY [Niallia sp. NCCP-28]
MMSKDMLSQDEIDALLRGDDIEKPQTELVVEEYLSAMEQDALGEIGNISFGSSATALSTLLNQKVDITTPSVGVVLRNRLPEEFPHPYVAIRVNYTEGFSGMNLLVIKQSDASIIADLMLGGDGINPSEVMGEIQMSAVQEAMNQMMGSAATSMSTIFNKRVDISPPTIDILDLTQGEGTDKIPADDLFVKISFRLKIGTLIDSKIMQLLQLPFAKKLVEGLLNTADSTEEVSNPSNLDYNSVYEPKEPTVEDVLVSPAYSEGTGGGYNQYAPLNQAAQPTAPQPVNHPTQHFGASFPNGSQPNVQPAVFSNFEPFTPAEPETKNLNMLLDIPLQVTVELGRTKRSVKEILELTAGSIIELDKLAGEPVDILVNNRLVAQGEVVVIDENFGVRVTDIVSQSDRLNKLR